MLADLLKPDRTAVLMRWSQLIVETYPPDTASFLQREKDRFLNPVGYTIAQETGAILDELVGGLDSARLSRSLDNLMGIRAVQEFSPSQAVGLIFLLKRVVRDGLGSRVQESRTFEELLELESRVDAAALIAFDAYMKRRERVYEIGANEAKRRVGVLLQRMNRLYGGDIDLGSEEEGSGSDPNAHPGVSPRRGLRPVDPAAGPGPAGGPPAREPLDKRGNGR